ncbi:MAG: UvrD-helicase domain-containing protein, partial [Lachnospiraceae bacterium]|nr:UvrD-helicase domain-containing protein [Lachnospiraceae bacterium]
FKLISLLAGKYRNLCVVGDDDQSIYKFRGANIYNILNFEQVFPDARVIKLEQNYRSTQNILNTANEVIRNNYGRKEKRLWTENEEGNPIAFRLLPNAFEEAELIIGDICRHVRSKEADYQDHAILYRTNAQSRLFEEKLILAGIPYKLIGGVNFYARREIKDVLAYLKTIDNGRDEIAVRRVINVPKRGIGATTLNRVGDYAEAYGIGFYDALVRAEEIPNLGRSGGKIKPFTTLIAAMQSKLGTMSLVELAKELLEETGYVKELEAEGTEEAKGRIENIDELLSKIAAYEESVDEPTLSGFLEEVALVADIDSLEESSNYVILMTLHSAKGLEFPYVYMAGMEEGIFPSYMSISADNPEEELEEERRLCYVGITRAKRELMLTAARQRMIRGQTMYNAVSRFIREIPQEYLENRNKKRSSEKPSNTAKQPAWVQPKESFRAKPYETQSLTVKKASGLDYTVGDRVRHIKFGDGTVLEITEGKKDYEVKVEFDTAGIKRLFASFAKLKKL